MIPYTSYYYSSNHQFSLRQTWLIDCCWKHLGLVLVELVLPSNYNLAGQLSRSQTCQTSTIGSSSRGGNNFTFRFKKFKFSYLVNSTTIICIPVKKSTHSAKPYRTIWKWMYTWVINEFCFYILHLSQHWFLVASDMSWCL